MNNETIHPASDTGLTLVLGGTGKTGRRVVERLRALGVSTRSASRSSTPAFDWNDPATWDAPLEGAIAVYLTYAPDLAIPGAAEAIKRFVAKAAVHGVQRLVLLSGRGEEEAQACERIVQASDIDWTIVRASWFMQNFSEGEFSGMVLEGNITLPASDVPEPFIDVEDIAEVVVAALTQEGHAFETYEVTGPRLLTFSDLADELSEVTGRPIRFTRIPKHAFSEAVLASGAPSEVAWLLNYLFDTVLDGRNASLGDGVRRALGREATDFSDFARRAAEAGAWGKVEVE